MEPEIYCISSKETFELGCPSTQVDKESNVDDKVHPSTFSGVDQKKDVLELRFPSFDDLFDNTDIHLLMKQRGATERDDDIQKAVESETLASTELCNKQDVIAPYPLPKLKKEDSLMQQDFSTTLYNCWEGSTNFAEFRFRFGDALNHKYFSCFRLDDTGLMGLYVMFGFSLVCTGVLCFFHCQTAMMVNVYLTVDGVLSTFIFPVLVMDWTVRVGGCVSEPNKVNKATFWNCVLIARIVLSILGAVMMVYTAEPSPELKACLLGHYISVVAIALEWIFLLLVIFIPLILLGISYSLAPGYGSQIKHFDGERNTHTATL